MSGLTSITTDMLSLESATRQSPLIQSIYESDLEAALEICTTLCPEIEKYEAEAQHTQLKTAEKSVKGKNQGQARQRFQKEIAYSILCEYHARMLEFFLEENGLPRKKETDLFDVHYFAGRNDFKILRKREYEMGIKSSRGLNRKAENHLAKADNLWNAISRYHTSHAYRHARTAHTRFLLLRIARGQANLEPIVKGLEDAHSCLAPESKDVAQVLNIVKGVIVWMSNKIYYRKEFLRRLVPIADAYRDSPEARKIASFRKLADHELPYLKQSLNMR